MQDLRNKITLKQTIVRSSVTRPPLDDTHRAEKLEAERELKKLQDDILNLAMEGEKTPAADHSADILLETQILCNHLKSLPKFTGTNPEATQIFLARVKGITESCPTLVFTRVLGAIKPNIAALLQLLTRLIALLSENFRIAYLKIMVAIRTCIIVSKNGGWTIVK